MNLLFDHSFSNTHSLCCLLTIPPIPSSSVCLSLYITVCLSYSPDYSTPSHPSIFPFAIEYLVLCMLLCHRSSLNYFKNAQRQFIFYKLRFEGHLAKMRGKRGVERKMSEGKRESGHEKVISYHQERLYFVCCLLQLTE